MEHLTDSQFEQYADEYNEKLGSVNRIIVSEKVSCLFNLNAQLFKMAAPIEEDDKEEKEEWSRCNSCGEGSAGANMFSDKKLEWDNMSEEQKKKSSDIYRIHSEMNDCLKGMITQGEPIVYDKLGISNVNGEYQLTDPKKLLSYLKIKF